MGVFGKENNHQRISIFLPALTNCKIFSYLAMLLRKHAVGHNYLFRRHPENDDH